MSSAAAGLDEGDGATLDRCVARGGVAVFPADTVYGLACDPESEAAVGRLYELKGRPRQRPAAVMFFHLADVLGSVPALGPRVRRAVERLLPGPVTLILPNPDGAFPLACGPEPERLGIRVPALGTRLAALAEVRRPVLQSSANPSGGADPSRLADVDREIRQAADLALDAGELPGIPSTVVDLSSYEEGRFSILREGAVGHSEIEAAIN